MHPAPDSEHTPIPSAPRRLADIRQVCSWLGVDRRTPVPTSLAVFSPPRSMDWDIPGGIGRSWRRGPPKAGSGPRRAAGARAAGQGVGNETQSRTSSLRPGRMSTVRHLPPPARRRLPLAFGPTARRMASRSTLISSKLKSWPPGRSRSAQPRSRSDHPPRCVGRQLATVTTAHRLPGARPGQRATGARQTPSYDTRGLHPD